MATVDFALIRKIAAILQDSRHSLQQEISVFFNLFVCLSL